MEQFEEVFSSDRLSDSREHQGVEELETEAFNRGLPEKRMTLLPDNEHGYLNPDQWEAGHLEHAAPFKISPVILLIDDEKPFRAVIKQVLTRAGYDVVEAADGVEGINRFYEQPTDMIITDIIMPEKEGVETIIELRRDFPDVKIIAISGGSRGLDAHNYLSYVKHLGVERVFAKPFDREELLEAIQELLGEVVVP